MKQNKVCGLTYSPLYVTQSEEYVTYTSNNTYLCQFAIAWPAILILFIVNINQNSGGSTNKDSLKARPIYNFLFIFLLWLFFFKKQQKNEQTAQHSPGNKRKALL